MYVGIKEVKQKWEQLKTLIDNPETQQVCTQHIISVI